MKIGLCLSLHTKINSKLIKDLNVKPKPIEQLGETTESGLQVGCIGKDFLNRIPPLLELRPMIDKGDIIKLNCCIIDTETINLSKKSTEWKKIFAS